jgi:hypothetical protein
MSPFDKIHQLRFVKVAEPNATLGLQSFGKRFTNDGGTWVWHSISKLDLDTDGRKNPKVTKYDPDHQDETSIGQLTGHEIDSMLIAYIVAAGHLSEHHGNTIPVGALGTVCYKSKMQHVIVGDIGPTRKFGEGSIFLHEHVDGPRVDHNGHIINIGIDGDVEIIWYPNTILSCVKNKLPFTQADIDREASVLFAQITK